MNVSQQGPRCNHQYTRLFYFSTMAQNSIDISVDLGGESYAAFTYVRNGKIVEHGTPGIDSDPDYVKAFIAALPAWGLCINGVYYPEHRKATKPNTAEHMKEDFGYTFRNSWKGHWRIRREYVHKVNTDLKPGDGIRLGSTFIIGKDDEINTEVFELATLVD